jgi:hypothetical protein
MSINSRALLVVTVVLLSVAFAGCLDSDDWVTEDFDGEYDAADGTVLTVDNLNGKVEITGWNGDKVVLHAVKRSNRGQDALDDVEIKVTESTGEIIIETEYDSTDHRASVNMEIKVPANVLVDDVKTSNGAIDLEGTTGNTTLKTSNGAISVRNVEGFVKASSSNGAITIKDTTGVWDVETSNGEIDVEVAGIDGVTEISSSNGKVTVHIDESIDADLDISSSNGNVDIHDLTIDDMSATDQHVTGKLGAGGVSLEISTSNGDVDVYKLT